MILVCRILHRTLAFLSTYSTSSANHDFEVTVDLAIKVCIQNLFVASSSISSVTAVFPGATCCPNVILKGNSCCGNRKHAARILLAILNVLNKDCWVWTYLNLVGSENFGADETAVMWQQLINLLCSNVLEQEADCAYDYDFVKLCSSLLAVIVNKVSYVCRLNGIFLIVFFRVFQEIIWRMCYSL